MKKEIKLTSEQELIKLKIENLANELFKKHNLNNWIFEWGYAINRLGSCHYFKRKIRLSLPNAVSNEVEAIDTLIHEIAHALTPRCGHNEEWKRKCIELGCNPERVGNYVKLDDNLKIFEIKKFVGTCPSCPYSFETNKRTSYSCGRCSKTYDPKYKLIYKLNPNYINALN